MPSRAAHFVFQKGSPWRKVLNAEIMNNYVFFDQVHKRYFEVSLQIGQKLWI